MLTKESVPGSLPAGRQGFQARLLLSPSPSLEEDGDE